MDRQYTEVDFEMIRRLQAKGFTSIRFELLDTGNPIKATVEIIPGKSNEIQLDTIALNSREIPDYFEKPSPMARYIIDSIYL